MSQYLIIRKLQVQNANAISSPFTYGFPAVTSFLGFAHALQRHFNTAQGGRLLIDGVGIVCHRFQMLDHRDGYDRILCLTGNPLNEKGERAPFVEEGRCRLTVSLVLKTEGLTQASIDSERLVEIIHSRMKLAGGDILSVQSVSPVLDDRHAIRMLMPGYALVERRSLVKKSMAEGLDALQAIHRYLAIQHRCTVSETGEISWKSSRESPGWLVPIATGYQALSPIGNPKNARDVKTPHRFAESLVTLGEFAMASRFDTLSDLLWHYRYENDLYWCEQEKIEIST